MGALLLAFASGISWGVADFLGGLKARKLPLLNVLLFSQGTGLVLVGVYMLIRMELAAGRGLCVLRRAVRPGGGHRACLPSTAGSRSGTWEWSRRSPPLRRSSPWWSGSRRATGRPRSSTQGSCWHWSAWCWRPARRSPAATARGAGFAVLSAIGFGFFFVGMDNASDANIGWAMLGNRITSFSLLFDAFLGAAPSLEGDPAPMLPCWQRWARSTSPPTGCLRSRRRKAW